ncbi:MAG TPA: DUF4834 domain-containing protein [Cyclobacteriaceae bacterium]|nr:DUF4834 domain-containing protein [Cyclobacteriaceae bacterium]
MFKLIIILVLLIYLLNKVSVFFFRMMGRPQQSPPPNFRRPADGSINVDATPKKSTKKGGLKGGEYVDYEEVK